ncbi:hypothetical protein KAW18_06720 [candidate division WOR-3 bacterium]|nr:hypothetical protein [candidate division WOR-3 bacterium]
MLKGRLLICPLLFLGIYIKNTFNSRAGSKDVVGDVSGAETAYVVVQNSGDKVDYYFKSRHPFRQSINHVLWTSQNTAYNYSNKGKVSKQEKIIVNRYIILQMPGGGDFGEAR